MSIKDKQFLEIAQIVARSSKCVSLKVGCVIVGDNRIISCGYNGTPPGTPNCCDVWEQRCPEHSSWSDDHEIHAEMNAIIWAATKGIALREATLYSTHEPCKNCTKHICGTGLDGIHRVVFSEPYYRESPENRSIKQELLRFSGILWEHVPA